MADTFTPPIGPSPGTSRSLINRVWRSDFGDGYVQRSPRGINARRTDATVVWEGLTHQQANQINGFFTQHIGEFFLYILPPNTTEKQWICDEWDRTEIDSNASAITARFEEVYDL